MSFATIEEAWGMGTFGPAEPAAAEPVARPPARPATTPFSRLRKPVPAGAPAGEFASPLLPKREDDDAAAQETARLLARTYARFGLPGLLRLLPPEAVAQLGPGRRGGGLWGDVIAFLSCPEKMLFVLLCAFALLVLWDSAAGPAAHLAPLHMTPFPVSMT